MLLNLHNNSSENTEEQFGIENENSSSVFHKPDTETQAGKYYTK